MADDLIPYSRPGDDLTGLVNVAAGVLGKRCVQIHAAKDFLEEGLATTSSGNLPKVAHPNGGGTCLGANKPIFGVAKYTAAQNKQVGIVREGVVPVRAGATITAGQLVMANALGEAIPHVEAAGNYAFGLAMNGAASGADAEIALF